MRFRLVNVILPGLAVALCLCLAGSSGCSKKEEKESKEKKVAEKDLKKAVQALRKYKVFGLAKSVSEYAFDRNLQLLGEDPKNYKFTDEPPNTAALAMQSKKADHKAIMVWNPFVLQVLKDNKDTVRLFDSSTIPEEIIDMVVVGQDSLDRAKGADFACCVLDVYYEMNRQLEGPDADKILVKLGEKFSKLGLEDMKTCVKETRFYKNPREALALFQGKKLPETMKLVSKFCMDKEMIKKEVTWGFGSGDKAADAQLRFDPSFLEKVRAKEKPGKDGDKGKPPVFKLAWSEYPSWSVFGVASELGLIDGREGKQGALEKKWGVDVVLELLEYDPCIQKYSSKSCDAVCVTNIDILAPAATRKSVAIMPTSTSVGADACLVLKSVLDTTDKQD